MSTEFANQPSEKANPSSTLPSRFEGMELDLLEVWKIVQSRLWVVALFLVTGLVLAVTIVSTAQKIYESSVTIQIQQRVTTPTGATSTEDFRSAEMLVTIQLGFMSRSLMLDVVDTLKLTERANFVPDGIPPRADPREYIAGFLLKNTSSELVRGSRLIKVSFSYPDRAIAREIAQGIVETYISRGIRMREAGVGTNVNFLQDEAKELEAKLLKSEQRLSDYTKLIGSISVDDSLNIVADQLKDLNNKLTAAKTDRLRLEADMEQVQAVGDSADALLEIGSIANLPTALTLRQRLNVQNSEINRLSQRYKQGHPAMKGAMEQIRATQELLREEALAAPKTLEIALRAARQNEASLEKEKGNQEGLAIANKEIAIQARVLDRQIKADQIAYEAILRRLNDELGASRTDQLFIQIMDDASPPSVVYPQPVLIFAAALVLSLVLGTALVLLLALADDTVKTVDEAESLLGLPVLGAIPLVGNKKVKVRSDSKNAPDTSTSTLPMLTDVNSSASEAFRSLRASIMVMERTTHSKSILITSSVPGEGKSFCALNLAIAFAQQGIRTLVVDGDLRRPVLEGRLLHTEGGFGLAQYLQGSHKFDALPVKTSVDGLDLIPAGRNILRPAELLSRTSEVKKFLEEAARHYDKVIVDSAPAISVSDSLSISDCFEMVLLVARCKKTSRRLLRRAVELFLRSGSPLNGVILNQTAGENVTPYGNRYHQNEESI